MLFVQTHYTLATEEADDFPVIGHLVMRTGLWDRQEANMQVTTKKCMAWSCFSVRSSVFGQRMQHFVMIL